MKNNECVPQKMSKYMLGFLILAAAAGLVVIGITLLPFFGFFLAVPLLALSIYIFRLHLNDQCEIDFPAE